MLLTPYLIALRIELILPSSSRLRKRCFVDTQRGAFLFRNIFHFDH